MMTNLKLVFFVVTSIVTVSQQQDAPPTATSILGAWQKIDQYDRHLVGLSLRGINYLNNHLGLKPGYRFVGISGQPKSQVIFGVLYKVTVVIRLAGNPYLYCDFLIYRLPVVQAIDDTIYQIDCNNGEYHEFTVTAPAKD